MRALRDRNTAIKRKACIIIHNMSKLVYNPAEAAPFLPRLLPEVKKVGVPPSPNLGRSCCHMFVLVLFRWEDIAVCITEAGGCATG